MGQLHQDFPETNAIIAWHNGDEFEFPEGMVRDGYYAITGYPTVWFDGWTDMVGGGVSMYPYYLPIYEERIDIPSNFEVTMHIFEEGGTAYNVEATVEIKNGNSTENLAVFVVLTETDVPANGAPNQHFVARNVWPNGMGLPLDFSVQTSHTWNTAITIEESFVLENCEVIVFIQNMDTKEIYQGTSKMATDISFVGVQEQSISSVQVYPNPATDRINIKASSKIINVEVYNHMGQFVFKTAAGTNILNFNTSQFESGMYMFRVQTTDGMFVETVIIK